MEHDPNSPISPEDRLRVKLAILIMIVFGLALAVLICMAIQDKIQMSKLHSGAAPSNNGNSLTTITTWNMNGAAPTNAMAPLQPSGSYTNSN